MSQITTADAPTVAELTEQQIAESQEQREAELLFGKKVKVKFVRDFPLGDITQVDGRNVRLHAGDSFEGIEVENDRLDIQGMVDQIASTGFIVQPLVLNTRDDGKNVLLAGNRRYGAARQIVALSEHEVAEGQRSEPSDLAVACSFVPVILYSGLTPEQETLLVNDQTSKSFTATEVFRSFVESIQGGYGWQQTAIRMVQQIARVTGSEDKLAAIEKITDTAAREKAITDWLTTFVQQFWYNGIMAGPVVKNLIVQTYLYQDGYTPTKPRVLMDSTRMRKLQTAIRKDKADNTFDAIKGTGPTLDALLDTFAAIDLNGKPAPDGKPAEKTKLKPVSEYEVLVQQAQQTVGRKKSLVADVLTVVQAGKGAPSALKAVHSFDICREAYRSASNLPKEVSDLLDLVFEGGRHEEFVAKLAKIAKPKKPKKPVDVEVVAEVVA